MRSDDALSADSVESREIRSCMTEKCREDRSVGDDIWKEKKKEERGGEHCVIQADHPDGWEWRDA